MCSSTGVSGKEGVRSVPLAVQRDMASVTLVTTPASGAGHAGKPSSWSLRPTGPRLSAVSSVCSCVSSGEKMRRRRLSFDQPRPTSAAITELNVKDRSPGVPAPPSPLPRAFVTAGSCNERSAWWPHAMQNCTSMPRSCAARAMPPSHASPDP